MNLHKTIFINVLNIDNKCLNCDTILNNNNLCTDHF